MSSVKATAKHKGGKRKAKEFHLERATKGGFISRTHFEQPKSTGRNMMPYEEPMVTPHPNLDHVHDHIDQQFGDQPPVQMAANPGDNQGGGQVQDNDADGE